MFEIVKMIFGSHLYGTATENSDRDYKGIFLPSKREIYLGKIPKTIIKNTKKDSTVKNTSTDIDIDMYSLHYFLELACNGETATLDMLHAPQTAILNSSDIWQEIVKERYRFYTKDLKALIGYARQQASKYGIRGSRLNDAKSVIDFCEWYENKEIKLKDIWDVLPTGEHIFKYPASDDKNNIAMYEICGRKIGETCKIEYLYNVVNNFYKSYGHRAKLSAKNEGIDWKAVSHAIRAAYQIKEILIDRTISFPLKERDFLIKVKKGQLHFTNEVQPILENLMLEVEELSSKSNLPKKVDRKFWDDFIIRHIDKYLKGK